MDCQKIVEQYLLNQNPLYAFSFPISILISIVIFGMSQAFNWSNNSYITQILIPISALLLTMVILDIISRALLSKSDMDKYMKLCKLWLSNPMVKENPILAEMLDMDFISMYNGNIEHFNQNNNEQFSDEIEINPLAEKDDDVFEDDEIRDTEATVYPSSSTEATVYPSSSTEATVYPSSTEGIVYPSSNDLDKENHPSMNLQPVYNEDKSSFSPFLLSDLKKEDPHCLEGTTDCNLCSGYSKPTKVSPIPGPQWIPQNAKTVQQRLSNSDYTQSKCNFN